MHLNYFAMATRVFDPNEDAHWQFFACFSSSPLEKIVVILAESNLN